MEDARQALEKIGSKAANVGEWMWQLRFVQKKYGLSDQALTNMVVGQVKEKKDSESHFSVLGTFCPRGSYLFIDETLELEKSLRQDGLFPIESFDSPTASATEAAPANAASARAHAASVRAHAASAREHTTSARAHAASARAHATSAPANATSARAHAASARAHATSAPANATSASANAASTRAHAASAPANAASAPATCAEEMSKQL